MHTFRGITSKQVDIFLGNLILLDNSYKNLKNGLIPVNTTRNKSGNPPEQLRPEYCQFFYSLGVISNNVTILI